MKYLLDTNTFIYYFKGFGNVKARLLVCQPSEIVLSSVVYYELQVGILNLLVRKNVLPNLLFLKIKSVGLILMKNLPKQLLKFEWI